jgi:hypothetical protein
LYHWSTYKQTIARLYYIIIINMDHEFFAAVIAPTTATATTGGSRIGRQDDTGLPRFLKDEDNNGKSTYLVDANGNAYEPYALSWRYLGMYADCDLTIAMGDMDGLNRRHRGRQLGNNNNNNNNGDQDDCTRKVLWAAVRAAAVSLCSRAATHNSPLLH